MAGMLTLGKPHLGDRRVTIDAPFYQAGLAGYSDAAMRLIARRHGCPFCITEAMLDVFLLNGGKGLAAAQIDDADHPITGQLMGSHPVDIAAGAKVLVSLGYDVVDVNLACPVKKIKKKARGGHLLSAPDDAIDILKAVIDAVGQDIPLTVKLRRSYDDSPEQQANFDRIFTAVLGLGYSGATVHSRTVQQKYIGPGYRPALRQIVEQYGLGTKSEVQSPKYEVRNGKPEGNVDDAVPDTSDFDIRTSNFLLGGSGDIWKAADIFDMLETTGVGWVSVARGCIGNPWIFTQARRLMSQDPDPLRPPTVHEQRDVLLEHFELSVGLHGEAQAGRMMRKFGIKFARHHAQRDAIKQRFIAVKTLADWHAVLDGFYAQDGPGVPLEDALPPEAEGAQASPDSCPEPVSAA